MKRNQVEARAAFVADRLDTRRSRRPHRGTIERVLLGCGVAYSALYVVEDVLGNLLYKGYSFTDNTWSELHAIGAPTRELLVSVGIAGLPLAAAFSLGLWMLPGPKRVARRITAVALLAQATVGLAAQVVFATLPREALAAGGAELRNTLRGPVTAVSSLCLMLALGFGATLLGRRFLGYSIATIVITLGAGVLAGLQGGRIEADLPTPWAGLEQRISAYTFVLWVAVLAIGTLRTRTRQNGHTAHDERTPRSEELVG